jgi:3-methyladenine DNA glycosylase AlkD
MIDPRLRVLLKRAANSEHAAFHKNYQKSSKKFYGLRTKQITEIANSVFPKREKISKDESKKLTAELWASDWFEEQAIGLILLERIQSDLLPSDLPYLKKIIGQCEGWAMLDWIATRMLGTLAMNYPEEIYPKVRTWTKSKHLWTRRAAILIHVLPARKRKLNAGYALPTFAELLHEKEFFIRKAIGWTLREIAKYYPEVTFEFLKEHKDEVSGLTLREGARRLPEKMSKELYR